MQTADPETEVRPEVLQLLDAMEDAVILADAGMNVRAVTPSMERLAGISADDALGADAVRIVADRILPEADQDARERILSLLQSRTGSGGITVRVSPAAGERWYAFSSRRLMETGDWLIRFRDVTRREAAEGEARRRSDDLAFLSRAATELAAVPPEADLFPAIGAFLHELAPGSVVIVSTADIRAGTLTPRAFFGIEPFLPDIVEVFGEDLTGISLDIPPHIRSIMLRGEIEEVKGGLEEIALGQISQEICRKFEDLAGFGAMYCIPFAWKGEIFGSAVILTRREGGEVNLRAVEVFRNLASIALQRHRAEADLRESEKTFRALIEKGSEFILIVDDQFKIRFASPPIERLDGFPPETLVGKRAFDMIQPEDLPRVKEVVSALAERPGGSVQFEVRFRGPRGTHVIEAIVTNLLDDPSIRGFVVNAWDITERKRTEEALRRAEQEKGLILDSTAEMFAYYDTDLKVLWVNRAAAAFIGREPEDLVGHRCYEIWHNRTGVCDVCPVVLARETGEPREAEITTPDGRVFFLRGYPVTDESGELTGLIEFAQEITERKQAEQELRIKDMAIASSLDAISLATLDGKITYVNHAFLVMHGWEREDEVLGEPASALWADPEEAQRVGDEFLLAGTWSGETEGRRRDGSTFPMQLALSVVTDEEGRPLCVMGSGIDITERKRAEEGLRAANAYNRSLVEANLDPLVTIGPDGRITDVNTATEQATGYARDELIGTDFSDYFTDPEGARAGYRKAFAEGQVRDYPLEIRHRDGTTIPVLYNASVYRDEEGGVRGVFAAARDITERKRAEKALSESEERYRTLVELMPEGVVVHRNDGTIVYVNPAGVRIAGGKGPEDFVGRSLDRFVHPDYQGPVTQKIRRLLQEGTSIPVFEQMLLTVEGRTIWVEVTAAPILYDGRPSIMVVFHDISERKQAQEALQRRSTELSMLNRLIGVSASALTLDELVESALNTSLALLNLDAGAIYLLDREANLAVLMSRRGMKRPDGLQAIDIFQRPLDEIFIAGRQVRISAGTQANEVERAMLDAFGVSALIWIPLMAESRIVGALAAGRFTEEGVPQNTGWLIEAISKEVGAGILRGTLYKQLEAANREANLYLDILTHDIRNANGVAILYTDLLMDILEGEPKNYVRKMKGSIDKSTEILANVAMIRKIHQEHAPLKPIDLHGVIVSEQKTFPEAGIRYGRVSYRVWADDLLAEVFHNLIGNAVKFGGPGVVVTISAGRLDGNVVVTVADTGPGVPDELKESIFHRFQRGRTRARGEGLGLYICRTLLERYGGRICVEDRVPGYPERGAAFRFTLKEVAE
ncbi:PAS domain S-box protein [Methanoculleus sp. Wushi-C6]|uniref:histidine kinase n=1 Tax=Methanoculleus caldifontis TaxID=2651577 RepID=A0ABU3WYS0_9EURY|nr:PAS domain S-box protein [Methanoculleus sp. Wushi-C6]MDV2480710.1 PAS domain S-box protein [Methanoculleus sp. Wushi-C6]